jgi:hypothetical protein
LIKHNIDCREPDRLPADIATLADQRVVSDPVRHRQNEREAEREP